MDGSELKKVLGSLCLTALVSGVSLLPLASGGFNSLSGPGGAGGAYIQKTAGTSG